MRNGSNPNLQRLLPFLEEECCARVLFRDCSSVRLLCFEEFLAEFHLVGAASSSIEDQVQAIRSSGYDGPLSMVVSDATSACSVVHLIAFKNLRAREEVQRRIGGFRYVLCRAVSALIRFFDQTLRPLLEPKESNKLLFVQVTGRDKGSWVDAKKDGFGDSCGHAKGLDLGTSIRSIRHIVSTEAVRCDLILLPSVCLHNRICRMNIPSEDRADICEANLHTMSVADKHYVHPLVAAVAPAQHPSRGDFIRGLGKRSFSISLVCWFEQPDATPSLWIIP